MGQEGIVEGIDYRGVPVIADVRSVPNSPWFLVARMDISEVYTPLRERLWEIVILIGALLICAGAGTGFVWRHQRTRFYREKYEAAEALRESEKLSERLLEKHPHWPSSSPIHTDTSPCGTERSRGDIMGGEQTK